MAHYMKRSMTKFRHYFDLVLGCRPLAVYVMVTVGGRLTAVAVASKVRDYKGESFCHDGGNFVPHNMSLRVTMQ
jgi:hypothetical protein